MFCSSVILSTIKGLVLAAQLFTVNSEVQENLMHRIIGLHLKILKNYNKKESQQMHEKNTNS